MGLLLDKVLGVRLRGEVFLMLILYQLVRVKFFIENTVLGVRFRGAVCEALVGQKTIA